MVEIAAGYVYCICPHCRAIYRLPESQLERGSGFARCSSCQEVFSVADNRYTKQGNRFVRVEAPVKPETAPTAGTAQDQAASKEAETAFAEERDGGRDVLNARYPRPDYREQDAQDTGLGRDQGMPEPDSPDGGVSSVPADEVPGPVAATTTSSLDAFAEGLEPPAPAPEPVRDPGENTQPSETGSAADSAAFPPEDPGLLDWMGEDAGESRSPVDAFSGEPDPRPETSRPEKRKKRKKYKARMKPRKQAVNEIIADRSHPLASFTWFLVMSGFIFLLGVQVKVFFVPLYAQDEVVRPYLSLFCKIADCRLPLRKNPSRFTLTHARISLHPTQPGSIRIAVKLVNEAEYAQPFPDLRITLTDQVGWVVGRRTYSPDLYLGRNMKNLMGKGELASVNFDLAMPHEKAVGFEVDIVSGT